MRFVPAIVFSTVYVITCLVGAVFLLLDLRPIVSLYEHFSGTHAPRLDPDQFRTVLILLVATPVLFWVGSAAASRVGGRPFARRLESRLSNLRLEHSPFVPVSAFVVSAGLAFVSLARSGGLSDLSAWLSYQAWIDARWHIFQQLSFFEFVNIYTLTPLTAAWVLLALQSRSLIIRILPTLVSVALALALYQKKAALVVLVIVFGAWLIDAARERPRRAAQGLAAAVAVGTVLYLVMVVVPTGNAAVEVARSQQRDRPVLITPAPSVATVAPNSVPSSAGPQRSALATPTLAPPGDIEVTQLDPVTAAILYSVVGTLMRTSEPALYYPVVYPGLHSFYPLDLGQDIVCSPRLGCRNQGMPDDNLVVWDYMNPQFHGGSVTAPFQFALYAQGGLVPAMAGALVLGFLLGLAWRAAMILPRIWAGLSGALVIILAVNLALDSARNSVVVTYGAMWGAIFLILCAVAVHTFSGQPRRRDAIRRSLPA